MTLAKAVTIFAPEDLRVVERPLGELDPARVRIRFGAGGICGSDMHYFRHARTGDFVVKEPLVLGHEIAGTVEAVGAKVEGLAPGTRVAVNPFRPCGHCPRCREGRANLCENVFFMGSASKNPHMQGGFATLFDTTPEQCVPVPDSLPIEAAALAEPLAVCLHAVKRGGDLAGRSVLVVGAGPIGLLTLVAAKLRGPARAAVVDLAAAPLAMAKALGADAAIDLSADPKGLETIEAPDVVFEASGTAAGLASAIRTVRRGGTVVQIGNLPGGDIPSPMNAVMAKEIDLLGTFRFDAEFAKAVDLIASGKVDVMRIVTARRPLLDAPAAFRLALDRSQSVKVVLTAA
ncbi:L-idonate 5-dehydrogenase [Aureimonas leprariae]|uniref:L-idonate 5-dehydrogenase n=1 Tax=Plantimonas leprariae TaxID=2615207 RepID=A0A7V7PRN8_9HYPH|nr:L-idonate 5-dehydrogenase [Aureimonas leprariae]KAB0681402.1 L-idonate 5-dehydrogenase [Aureimonas leprariae]